MTLPGASDWKSAKQWKEWSNLVYEEKIANRLRESSNKVTSQLTNRQLEEYKPEVSIKDLLKPQRTKKTKTNKGANNKNTNGTIKQFYTATI